MSYQLAKKLAEYGFPQPAPKAGQIWVNAIGTRYLVLAANAHRADYVCLNESGQMDGNIYYDRGFNDGEVYLPTAEEVMQETAIRFPRNWITARCLYADKWMCEYGHLDNGGRDVEFGKTLLEAVSEHYFSLVNPE